MVTKPRSASLLPAPVTLPQPLAVAVSSIPEKDWWERFPVSIGISILALACSIVPFIYSTWPAREDASVAVIRWTTPFTPDGTLHPQVWLAVANRGNRDVILVQSPFMYQLNREAMAFADDVPLETQSTPVTIEPGKSIVIRVATDITPAILAKARATPDQTRSDEKGSKAVVKLSLNIVVAHPDSGHFSSAMTNCLRVMLYEAEPVRAEVDPRFTGLTPISVGKQIKLGDAYPCLNDSPAPRVT